ncbi:MAG TPA: UPF0182 family protein, partial [Pontimonas sp.]|nr:UPF0182 family protein [Pontimonas sp.]
YVQSTGDTSYPLLRKILVSFGEKIAFEDTLDQALDALFGGDSGAEAGDSDGAPGTVDAAEEETTTPAPAPEPNAETEADAGADADADTGIVISTGLKAALEDVRQALADREAAYRANDLVAAAEADRRLTDALGRALVLSDQ